MFRPLWRVWPILHHIGLTRYFLHAIITNCTFDLAFAVMKRTARRTLHLLAIPILMTIMGLILGRAVMPQEALAQGTAPSSTPVATSRPPPYISNPIPGQNVQGNIVIMGSTDVQGFTSYSVDFTYQGDQTHAWFGIQSGTQNVIDGTLARWDTQLITDGDYRLRLRVITSTGDVQRFIVDDIRVRNYTAADTPTAQPPPNITLTPTAAATLTAAPTATSTPFASPTRLPSNPIEVTSGNIRSSVGRGALAAILLFGIFGIFIILRRH
jgi:hypothetical protein